MSEREAMELPPWMQSIRDSIASAIRSEDLQAIMKKQVEKAIAGDERAARFVFEQARKFSEAKGLTIVQNNYYDDSGRAHQRPDQPTRALPGSPDKVKAMQRRLQAGEPLNRIDDRGGDGDPEANLS